jgi:hypothetical protein
MVCRKFDVNLSKIDTGEVDDRQSNYRLGLYDDHLMSALIFDARCCSVADFNSADKRSPGGGGTRDR